MRRVFASGWKGLPFSMPIAASRPIQSGSARLAGSVSTSCELLERAGVLARQQVGGHVGSVRVGHGRGLFFPAERVDTNSLESFHAGAEVCRILVESAEEDEDVVGLRAEDIVAVGDRAVAAWRQKQELVIIVRNIGSGNARRQ